MRRLPAEWHPQQRVLLCFPRRDSDWGDVLDQAARAMLEAARLIQLACPVTLIVPDRSFFSPYATDFTGAVCYLPADDSWIRDSGPITVFEDGPLLLDFQFNGWGGKFDATRDNALPREIHRALYPHTAYQEVPQVLEGGSIESDGAGTLLTTTRCLLSTGRNGFTDKQTAEAMLRTTLGAERIIWLDHGELIGDDTDAHIDTVARFLTADTIAYVGPPPAGDPQHAEFTRMREELRERSTGYRLVELPWVDTIYSSIDGHQLPASYANFLISNGHLFLPTYGVATDELAQSILAGFGYRVVPVPCRSFIEQHGGLHCLTMQIPSW
ncbi:Agmatine deiminase [Neolewinella maritima]|uniref:Agmatine deiminase n=1 Tax=Neolewinella maritima TaxID=1383882 RepID=A0ABM9B055_9BACT|nr:agmatine deiminase family protein [Neolewinella maritima]CAH1000468.1 Agmatine deiminase [Neolewinella maritima]